MGIEASIRAAIETGEILEVIYYGGSQPGTRRKIQPRSISHGLVKAWCAESATVKSFSLRKLHLAEEGGEKIPPWEPGKRTADDRPRYESLVHFVDELGSYLSDLGWHVETEESSSISLHRPMKNGRVLKGADVALSYHEFAWDEVFWGDEKWTQENKRPRERPWTVRAKKQQTRTFATLDKAADLFLEWAKDLAPTS